MSLISIGATFSLYVQLYLYLIEIPNLEIPLTISHGNKVIMDVKASNLRRNFLSLVNGRWIPCLLETKLMPHPS